MSAILNEDTILKKYNLKKIYYLKHTDYSHSHLMCLNDFEQLVEELANPPI